MKFRLSSLLAVLAALWVTAASAIAAPQLVPENLAAGRPASASKSQAGHDPSHAVDDDLDTRWCSDGDSTGFWWQVDLGSAQDVAGARIFWEAGEGNYQFRIEGSADGKTWTMLSDQTKTKAIEQDQLVKFNGKGVRYVRITVTGKRGGLWSSFYEFQVLGTKMVPFVAAKGKNKLPAEPIKPGSVEDTLRGIKVPAGFEATLFAAPPDVSYPTCVAAAPTGEVFVGIDENGSLGKGPGRGKVVRCIDTDGDGKADKFNTFVKVDNPRGLYFDNNTLIVLHPPFIHAYHNDNGDGVSDRETLLVKGLGSPALAQRGADHCTNGFRVGIDGWLYIAVGDFGCIKAEGSDGSNLQLMGGGILRVRPDGSRIELVAQGLRNIYDVAVSPLMDKFTRDNTNDGGGWNVRLSHIIGGKSNYGYPMHFVNFTQDMIPALADYGGGSPCGALFLDEPGFPGGHGNALYTCDWGRGIIFRHPLTPNGADFKPEQVDFVSIPRPTDMDVDGSGRLYITSWKDGGFSFSKPEVGYVVRVVAKGNKGDAFPNLKQSSDSELLSFLASDSHTKRFYASREILRRGDNPAFAAGLQRLAASQSPLAQRVAAIFTLKQLRGAKATDALVKFSDDALVREYALTALADHMQDNKSVPVTPFLKGTLDTDPRVRLAAAIGLGRLGNGGAASSLLPLTSDKDTLVAHAAVQAMVELKAADVCVAELERNGAAHTQGALRVLQALHEGRVVDNLIARLGEVTNTDLKQDILRTLCRLYYIEEEWKGQWWGTRPDTRGPYYRPVSWAKTADIDKALRAQLAKNDKAVNDSLMADIIRHRIEMDDVVDSLVKQARTDPTMRSAAVELILSRPKLPKAALELLEDVASASSADVGLRARALLGLQKALDTKEGFTASVRAIASMGEVEKLPAELARAREEFVRDVKLQKHVEAAVDLAADKDALKRELAYCILLQVPTQRKVSAHVVSVAKQAIDKAWSKLALTSSLVRAVGQMRTTGYEDQIRNLMGSPDKAVQAAATFAAGELKLIRPIDPNNPPIEKLGVDKATELAMKSKGNPAAGAKLFVTQGCANCHTVSKKEPLKGPFLGDIITRYKRDEIVESILNPNAKIAQGFQSVWYETDEGDRIDGFVVRETNDEVEMRVVAGTSIVIKKKSILDQGKLTSSIMPAGLVNNLTVGELGDLVAYLESLKEGSK